MKQLDGIILTPEGFVDGSIEFADVAGTGRIQRIHGEPLPIEAARDAAGPNKPFILPGFIDLHVHGGGNHDIMEGGEAARHVAALHARHGTTALLATTMTAPPEDLRQAFVAMSNVLKRENGASRATARILGVHLEGPYINRGKLGAQPDFSRPLAMAELAELHALAPIRLITLAPEVDGHMDAIETLRAQGYKVQIGHTLGSYEDGVQALARGADSFTHLFNAMTGLHHREPGMAGAALAHAEFAELIPDLLHVHPGAIRAALRAIPRLFCVTDSTAAAGMPDGEYRLGSHTVVKCMGGVRLADGTLAGSTLTMDQALRNLVEKLGLDLADAARRVSTYPAEYLGIGDRGRLAPGAIADLAVFDRDLALTGVFLEGTPLNH